MISIKNFESSLLKIDKKLSINIDIYYIGCMAIKSISDFGSINSVNPLRIIISESMDTLKKKNGNKYFVFASTDKNKEVLKKYRELWDGVRNLIECNSVEKIKNKPGEYEKKLMEIKSNLDDNLPLNKIL